MPQIKQTEKTMDGSIRFEVEFPTEGKTFWYLAEEYDDIPDAYQMVVSPRDISEAVFNQMEQLAAEQFGAEYIDP